MGISCSACGYSEGIVENRWTVVLRKPAQSMNVVGVNGRGNHRYRKARSVWLSQLDKHHVPLAYRKRRIFFTRFYGARKRAYDYGNLVGGFKPLLDMIVEKRWLIDDKPKYCEDYYLQFKSPDGCDYTVIVIEDYEESQIT